MMAWKQIPLIHSKGTRSRKIVHLHVPGIFIYSFFRTDLNEDSLV